MFYRNLIAYLSIIIGLVYSSSALGDREEQYTSLITNNTPSVMYDNITFGLDFYGIPYKEVRLADTVDKNNVLLAVADAEPSCLLIDATAMEGLDSILVKTLFSSVDRRVFVFGLRPDMSSSFFDMACGTAPVKTQKPSGGTFKGHVHFIHEPSFLHELSGITFAFDSTNCPRQYVFTKEPSIFRRRIISYTDSFHSADTLTTFASIEHSNKQIYFMSDFLSDVKTPLSYDTLSAKKRFYEIAPVLIFLKNVLGDYCWHAPYDFANLTIDDPWLRKQYGFLKFEKLVEQMNRAGFHSTIGFIPWNYDRSNMEVVRTFRDNPERLSICVHGNNHNHSEFGNHSDLGYAIDERNCQQALSRMALFRDLTGLEFDSVMIFPHTIAPESTLVMLQSNGYFATINSHNIPDGAKRVNDPFYLLRPGIQTRHGGILSFWRSPARYTLSNFDSAVIAFDLFLDNPVMRNTHHQFFAKGMEAFNHIAGFVNKVQPDVRWANPGTIVHYAYLVQRKNDTNWRVFTFSQVFYLVNKSHENRIYHVVKDERSFPDVLAVTGNGGDVPFEINDSFLQFTVTVEPRDSVLVRVHYPVKNVTIPPEEGRYNFTIRLIRNLSDFRDNTLIHLPFGARFADLYYRIGVFKLGLFGVGIIILFIVTIIIIITVFPVFISRRTSKKR